MNDFTKNELKTILWHITTKTSIKPGNDLAPKIQDMIDNYCEHEDTRQICDADYVKVCADCDETLGFL